MWISSSKIFWTPLPPSYISIRVRNDIIVTNVNFLYKMCFNSSSLNFDIKPSHIRMGNISIIRDVNSLLAKCVLGNNCWLSLSIHWSGSFSAMFVHAFMWCCTSNLQKRFNGKFKMGRGALKSNYFKWQVYIMQSLV